MNGLVYQPNSAAVAWQDGVKTNFALPPGISDYITNGAYTSIPSEKLAFVFSGMVSANNSVINYGYGTLDSASDHVNKSAPVFLKADLSTLANITFEKLDWPSWITPRSEASMVWLPYGSKGILLVVGGAEIPQDLFMLQKGSKGSQFMTQILVYDVGNNAWHLQQTQETGSSPSQLAAFCTVVTSTQDGSQHFIYAYGGYDGAYDPNIFSSDVVWVLSIPSFQWILVNNGTDEHRRQSHVCLAPNPTTMISIGGVTENGNYLLGETNIDVFDLNALTWTGRYESNSTAAYEVPEMVTKQIGGNKTGGFTVPYGLNDSLYAVFSQKYQGTITKPTECPVANTTSPPLPPSPHHAWRIPAIASVSTVGGIALLSMLALVFYRRHRRAKEGLEKATKMRRHVLLWLRKSDAADAPQEKSQSSDKTAVEDQEDYFSSNKYPDVRVFEAPSSSLTTPGLFGHSSPPFGVYSPPRAGSVEVDAESRYEIMDNPRTSISQHPLYPRSLHGDFVRSVRSNSESTWHFPEGLKPHNLDSNIRARSGSISPFELPQDNGIEFLSLPPAETCTNATSNISELQAEQTDFEAEAEEEETSSNVLANKHAPRKKSEYATPSQSPVTDKRFSLPIPLERRSSISSSISNLPSPGQEEDFRRSRAIDELPDRRESLIPAHPLKEKRSGPVKSVYREEFDD